MKIRIKQIINAILNNKVYITEHADEEAKNDNLMFDEIYFSVIHGEIIENYPEDKPYPSCLIYGKSFNNQHIHSVWAYDEETENAILITVYKPDPFRWINFKKRRI